MRGMKSISGFVVAGVMLAISSQASAELLFKATLTGDQEVPPSASEASGLATLVLNDAKDQLSINIMIVGLDLDDITRAHIHAAPEGSNGPVVFGLRAPDEDIDAGFPQFIPFPAVLGITGGTIVSTWDLGEDGGSLGDSLDELFNQGLYINIHTDANQGGEIRGQIIPEPATLGLLLASGVVVFARRRP